MAKKAKIDTEKCKGCHYCVDVCPKAAVKQSGRSNKKGYNCVEIEPQKCNGCGACYVICPDCCIKIIEK